MPDWTGAGAGSLFSTINPFPLGANVTYESVRNADLSTLSGAVDSLSALTAKLTELDEDAQAMDGMAQSSLWAGLNATVSRAHIRRTAQKFTHARTQAESLHNILDALLTDLRAGQTTLLQLEQSSEAEGVRVSPDGTISSAEPPHLTLQQATRNSLLWNEENVSPETFHAMRDTSTRINQALEEATESDRIAARALADIIGEGNGRFSETGLNSMEDAARDQVQQDAHAFTDLAGKQNRTPAEWKALGQLAALHADDPAFAEYAIDTIGMENYLALAQELDHSATDLASANIDVDSIRAGMANTLNTAVQPSIDIATHPPGSDAYQTWLRTEEGQAYERRLNALNAVGPERLYEQEEPSWLAPVQDQRIGYDLFLDLMESADEPMSDIFYYDMLDGMVAAEKESPIVWAGERYPDTEHGWDPKNNGTDRLLALGARHNVEATTHFFDPDQTDNLDYFIGDGDDSRTVFFSEKPAFELISDKGYGQAPGLTVALETAATGRPLAGTAEPDYAGHSAANIRVAEHIWNSYAEDPSRASGNFLNPDMRPALGTIAADYILDIQRAADHATDNSRPEASEAVFNRDTSGELLWEVGKNQEAYEKVTVANQIYTHLAIDEVVQSVNGSEDREALGAVSNIANRGGVITGIMTDSHVHSEYARTLSEDAENNATIDAVQQLTDTFLAGAIYGSMEKSPGGASISADVQASTTQTIFDIFREDNSAAAAEDGARKYTASRSSYIEGNVFALEGALDRADLDLGSFEAELYTSVEIGSRSGYEDGKSHIESPS
ncbi:hypothetical protein SUDANB171_03292 [Streptomyces sp. enrichment culture]|uniref:hypothetical protein n=1 Tax=Streptomyces sp. enrichment culture TaxID=1795815 RepID=UPI003F556232